jgi:hypothetical protein
MKIFTLLLNILFIGQLYGQQSEAIKMKHKKYTYSINNICKDSIEWDEIIVADKVVESKINKVIKDAAISFKLDSLDLEVLCKDTTGSLDYSVEFHVNYSKNNLLSVYFSKSEYLSGTDPNSYASEFNFNFNLLNGEQFAFHDLFLQDSISALDTLIIQRLKYAQTLDLDLANEAYMVDLKKQLPYISFRISEDGITLKFIGTNDDSFYDIGFPFTELKRFANPNGILNKMYSNLK